MPVISPKTSHSNFEIAILFNEQAFDSVDRRALTKVLSLYGIPETYIKVICAMYENNTAVVKVGNEVSNWFCIKPGVFFMIF